MDKDDSLREETEAAAEMVRASNEDGSGAASPSGIEIGISCLSVTQINRVVQTFSQFKRDLVNAIGFGGLLHLPNLPKLNLKFSFWLLNRVDVKAQGLVVDEDHMLRFYPEDVERVFGIPCGLSKVDGPDATITQDSVRFMRQALGLVEKDSHSLKRVECFLMREITDSSSRLEQECFQAAFVIFSIGHLLAPAIKHDYITVDYWGALRSADHIVHYNWCEYVVRCVIEAARKVQTADPSKGPITVPDCHLFLQVFFLDNMDVRSYKMAHKVFPRISEFDSEVIKTMIQHSFRYQGSDDMIPCVQPRVAESVCYSRSRIERSRSRGESVSPNWRLTCTFSKSTSTVGSEQKQGSSGQNDRTETPPSTGIVQHLSITDIDLTEFLNPSGLYDYLKRNHPSIVGSELVDLLKRHNAMCIKNYVTHQCAMFRENILLAENLISMLGGSAIKTVVRPGGLSHGNTPSDCAKRVRDGLVGQQLKFEETEEGEGDSSGSRRMIHGDQSMASGSQSKRVRFSKNSADAVKGKQLASAGSQSASSGRSTSAIGRDDIPSFDLGIDDHDYMEITGPSGGRAAPLDNITPPPAGKQNSRNKQSPRSANKGFSDLLIGEMLLLQDEKRTVHKGKVLFGDATPILA